MDTTTKRVKSKWILLTLATFVTLTGFVIWNQGVTARPQEDGVIALSVEDEQSGVSYLIGVDNLENEVIARVEYDHSTMAGLDKYRAFNNRELAKILQNAEPMDSIPLKITFNSPQSQKEFTDFVKQHEIDVESYYIYMLEPDGKIATIQGGPSEEELVPGMFFNAATDSVTQEYAPGAEFLGWVEVDGAVQANRVSQISNDQRVFLVDVMQLFLEAKLTDELLAEAGIAKDIRRDLIEFGFTGIHRGPLAGHLYHLGLEELDTQK